MFSALVEVMCVCVYMSNHNWTTTTSREWTSCYCLLLLATEKLALSSLLIDDGRSAYTKDHNLLSISGYIDVYNWFLCERGLLDLSDVRRFCSAAVIAIHIIFRYNLYHNNFIHTYNHITNSTLSNCSLYLLGVCISFYIILQGK